MGYYENPPIIQPGRGSEIVSSAIMDAANSISRALIEKGERKRQEEKENKLTLQKLQERKNEADLLYSEKLTDWRTKQVHTNDSVDKQVYSIMQDEIKNAADARIMLLNETNPSKRQEYLKTIRNANVLLDGSANFAKSIAGQTATWRLNTKGLKVGEVGGHFVNGATDEEILDNTAGVEILGGMNAKYIDPNINLEKDEDGDGLVLTVTGKHIDTGRDINFKIHSKTFDKSEVEGEDGLLIPVESLDTFHTQAKEDIIDSKNKKIYDGYLTETRETYDLDSKGTSGGNGRDIYQITNGRRLQVNAAKAAIGKKAEITAAGMVGADSPTRLRAMLDYTLKKGPGFYDKNFKVDENGVARSPEVQKQMLKDMLVENSFNNMVKELETTTTKDGEKIYWNPTSDVKLKDKPSNAELGIGRGRGSGSGSDKPEPTSYKTEYYNNIIMGYNPKPNEKLQEGQIRYRTRQNMVENLNKLSGSADKFMTREDLYARWLKQPYKEGKHVTDNTIAEEYKEKGKDPKTVFDKLYPKAHVFVEDGANSYKPLKGYDLNSAEGRVRLALDQTSDAGEIKILQKSLGDAKLMDWVRKNPIRKGESQQAYAARASKSL
jgi:hypothetical protein